jgi:uncharacterized protein YqjF (DUF2071 family)
MSFLKAEWRKLAIANYAVNESVLQKHLPAGTELDLWKGKCYVSVVGFMFVNTKLLGIKIPFHVNFEEVNLRFYVKRFDQGEWKRGVVFIKEIVPKWALSFVANTVYKENYETLLIEHSWKEEGDARFVEYRWKKNNKWHSIQVEAKIESTKLETNSETEFITEHYWGYARVNDTKTNEYEVTHPRWDVYEVTNYHIDIDFGAVYGSEFSFLNSEKPASVMLAEGSEITVEGKVKLKIE